MTRDAIIDKIRKLHARALRGGTAEEAATAARKAHELKTAHGITDQELLEIRAMGRAITFRRRSAATSTSLDSVPGKR